MIQGPPEWGEGFQLEQALVGRDVVFKDEFVGQTVSGERWKIGPGSANIRTVDQGIDSTCFGSADLAFPGSPAGVFLLQSIAFTILPTVDFRLLMRVRCPGYGALATGTQIDLQLKGAGVNVSGWRIKRAAAGAAENLYGYLNGALYDLGFATPDATHLDIEMRNYLAPGAGNSTTYWRVNGQWIHSELVSFDYTGAILNISGDGHQRLLMDYVELWTPRVSSVTP